ncbi:MAG: hypothetical protein R3C49_24435 [Planctomycetaceae bacterium]
MCAALACPNCRYRMELQGVESAQDLRCPDCGRTSKVPHIPRRLLKRSDAECCSGTSDPVLQAQADFRSHTRDAQSNSVMLWIAASLPMVLLAVCLLPLMQSPVANGHTDSQVIDASPISVSSEHAVVTGAAEPFAYPVTVVDSSLDAGSVLPAINVGRLRNLAGRYRVSGRVNGRQRAVFGTDWLASPMEELEVSIRPDLHRTAVIMVWDPAESKSRLQADRLLLDDRPGFPAIPVMSDGQLHPDWQLATNFVRFSEADLNSFGAAATAETQNFIQGKLSRRQVLLSREEWLKGGQLRDRKVLATILTTWELSGETLTIRRQAYGDDVRVVKSFIAFATGRQLAAAAGTSQEIDDHLTAFMEGQTLKLQRIP